MRSIIALFIIFAPVIDYTYTLRFPIGKLMELSPNRIYKGLPILLCLFFIILRPKRSFLWKYSIFLLYFTSLSAIIGFINFPAEVLDSYIRFVSSFIFIFIAGKILDEDDIATIGKALLYITLIPIIVSYLQFFEIVSFTDFDYIGGFQIGRVSGGYEKQVAMMAYLMVGFSFALFSFFHTEKVHQKIFNMVYVILTIGVVGLSTHRVSMIVFFLILIYFFYRYNKKYLLFLPIIILLFVFRYSDILKEVFLLSAGFGKSDWGLLLRGKFGFWYDYLNNLFTTGPVAIVFGKGHSVLDTRNTIYLPYLFGEPHSDIVRITYQYGLVGIFLFICVLFTIVKRSYEFRKYFSNLNEKLIGDLGVIIGIALMLYSLTIEPTRYPSYWWFYSTIASFILVNWRDLSESCVYNTSLSSL